MHQGEHSAILSNFIKLPFVIKTFVLSIFEWLCYTRFTVLQTDTEWKLGQQIKYDLIKVQIIQLTRILTHEEMMFWPVAKTYHLKIFLFLAVVASSD